MSTQSTNPQATDNKKKVSMSDVSRGLGNLAISQTPSLAPSQDTVPLAKGIASMATDSQGKTHKKMVEKAKSQGITETEIKATFLKASDKSRQSFEKTKHSVENTRYSPTEEEMYEDLEESSPVMMESATRILPRAPLTKERQEICENVPSRTHFAREPEYIQKDSVIIHDLVSTRTYKPNDKRSSTVQELIEFAEQVCSVINSGLVTSKAFGNMTNILVNDVTSKVPVRAFLILMKLHFIFLGAGFHGLIFYNKFTKRGIYINPTIETLIPADISKLVEENVVGMLGLVTGTVIGNVFFNKETILIFKVLIDFKYKKHISSILIDVFHIKQNPNVLSSIKFEDFKKYFAPICSQPLKTHLVPSITNPKTERKSTKQVVSSTHSEIPMSSTRSQAPTSCSMTTIETLSKKCTMDPIMTHFTNSNELFFIPMMMGETSNIDETYAMFDEVRKFEREHPLITDELRAVKNSNVMYDIIINSYLLVLYIILGNLRHENLPTPDLTTKWWRSLHETTRIWISKEYASLAKMMYGLPIIKTKLRGAALERASIGEDGQIIIAPCNSNLQLLSLEFSDAIEFITPSLPRSQ
jgi:hypothetical protein